MLRWPKSGPWHSLGCSRSPGPTGIRARKHQAANRPRCRRRNPILRHVSSAAGLQRRWQLEWKSVGGELAWIGYARIAALRLYRFDNHYFASNQSVQNTTSSTDTDFLTLTQTPLALSHAIIAVAHCNPASTTVTGYLNIYNGSTIQEWNRESPGVAGYFSAGLAQRQTLSGVSTIWKWRARAETSGTTVNVGNLAIAVLQLEATPAPARRRYMALAG